MAFEIYQGFSKATSTSSQSINISAAMTALKQKYGGQIIAEITTKTQDLVAKFDSAASDTLTSDAYPQGNYSCLAGTVKSINVPKNATSIHFKAAGVGAIFINLGAGEPTPV